MCSSSYSEHRSSKIIEEFSLHGHKKERKRFRLFKVMNNLTMFCFNGCLPRYNVLLLITTWYCTKLRIYHKCLTPPPPKCLELSIYNLIILRRLTWSFEGSVLLVILSESNQTSVKRPLSPPCRLFYGLEFFIHVYVYI